MSRNAIAFSWRTTSGTPQKSGWQDATNGDQPACKPGSVQRARALLDGHSSGTPVAKRLVQSTRAGTSGRVLRHRWPGPHARPYLILLPVGFALPLLLPEARCALTAPFHPYLRVAPLAVCFLWHFPWGCPRRPLAATVSSWSPDFPRRTRRGHPVNWRAPFRQETAPRQVTGSVGGGSLMILL